MHRKLSPAETLYVSASRSRAVLTCQVHGDVDEKLLGAAVDAKVAQHPSLRSRVGLVEGAPALLPLPGEPPALIVRPLGPGAFAEEMNTPLSADGPLFRAVLLRGSGEHTFVLSVDHTVTDGHSALALHDALWRTYAELADGAGVPDARQENWPEAATDLLPHCSEQRIAEHLARRLDESKRGPIAFLPYEAAIAGPSTGPGGEGPGGDGLGGDGLGGDGTGQRVQVQRVLLESDATARLVRYSRAVGLSVHGLVSGALLAALRRRLGGIPGPLALGCLSPVDLRGRVTPPIGREVMIPAVTGFLDILQVPADADPLALGREVVAHLRTAIERGDFVPETHILPEVIGNPALLATSLIVTNLGSVPGPPAPTGLRLTGMRLIPVREQYYPQAGRGPLMACVTSFDGRLAIELPYSTECFGHEQIGGIRADVEAALLSFADRDGDTATVE
ncbi:protein kinase [Kitasatospora sp. NPDC057015]|uniref:phthiocerol/phthiodiolone dimycocerosyl transferase family protein n=1 Tax=Kitasatospora sp. NPDC057015 TaxID=3346001 RepID=UPI0036313021